MFVFGVHIDSQEVFDRHCLPAIAAFGGADATLITSPDTPIAGTYNQMLQASLEMDDVEAIVLLRQDVEITDPRFLTKVREAFARDPELAVIGPVGGQGVTTLRWWQAPKWFGRLGTPQGTFTGVNEAHDVDCVDGLCMILRADLAARIRFDDIAFTGRSGYDVDLCFRVREAGLRVAVEPIEVVRHGNAHDDDESFRSAAAAWQGKRADALRLRMLERIAARTEPGAGADSELGSVPTTQAGFDLERPELIEHLPARVDRVLDVGCGAGTRGLAMKQASGAHVTGIEHGTRAAAMARTRLDEVHEIDLAVADELPWQPAPYDVIVLADVLTRLADPEAVLRLLVPHLRPDGVVILTVPNVKHWSVLLPLLLHDRWEYQAAGPLQHGSLRFFTMVEIAGLLRAVGLGTFDTCAAQLLPLDDESRLDPLLAAVQEYGVDAQEARTLLNSYEYVIVARRG